MFILKKRNWRSFIKKPRYLTLCRSRHEKQPRLLRLDLNFKGGTAYQFSFNNIKTGLTFTSSENLEEALGILEDRGYDIMYFNKVTEYYQYILDFLAG